MIPFIDLKAQQDRIKTDLNQRIQKVLDHGQYIMGPEVAELEGKLAGLEAEMVDPSAYANGGTRLAEIGREQQQLRDALANAEAEWAALYE